MRSIQCSWLLRRSRACFQSKIPFLIRKCAHLIVSAHISLHVKHLTQVCAGEKQSHLLSSTSPLWFWRRIRLVVHFRDKFLSFLCCETSDLKNGFSSQCQKEPVSFFNQYFRIFSGILAGQSSSAAKNFVRGGQSMTSLVTDVILGPTGSSVCFLSVENWYEAPVKCKQVCFGEGHGLFGLILAASLGQRAQRRISLPPVIALKLKLPRTAQNSRPLDSCRLKDPTIASAYNAPSITSSTPWQMQPDLNGNTSRKKSLNRSRARLNRLSADPRNPGYPVTPRRLLISVDPLASLET